MIWTQAAQRQGRGADERMAKGNFMANHTRLRPRHSIPLLFVCAWLASAGLLRSEEPGPKPPPSESTLREVELPDDELLELVQRQTFRYFYDFGHPDCGLARERSAPALRGTQGHRGLEDIVTTGGTGFGLMAFPIAVDREWIRRTDAVDRLLKIVRFLERVPRFHGMWAHWYMGNTGEVRPFSQKDDGGDLVESAFLLQGLLAVRQFFDAESPEERELRQTITRLWHEADWRWYQNGKPWLHWHWSPKHQFEMNMPIMGYDECMIAYVLAVASPTHPIDPSLYHSGWAIDDNARFAGKGSYVQRLKIGPDNSGGPLFFSHYSFLGLSPYLADKYVTQAGYRDYAERHRAHNLFCVDWCRKRGYPESCWGLTSSDDPLKGYKSHCAEDGPRGDNGTITPSAALSSIVYTPRESLAFLRYIWEQHRDGLWDDFGFRDAFNLDRNWYAPAHLAIDQGPIIVMIENYRSGRPWIRFMSIPEIQSSLKKLELTETQSVTSHRDIVFAEVDGQRLQLDIHMPTGESHPPLIVWIHGGGWRGGSKNRPPIQWLTKEGYAVASISYRFTDKAIFPAQIHDCKAAIRWLRANAKRYGYDSERIAVTGGSAGGHLALLLGVTDGVEELEGDVGGNLDHNSRVQAIVDYYGPSDFILRGKTQPDRAYTEKSGSFALLGGLRNGKPGVEMEAFASPASYVSPDDPPLLVFHGSADEVVLLDQSQRIVDLYNAAGLDARLHVLDKAGHGGRQFFSGSQSTTLMDFLDQSMQQR